MQSEQKFTRRRFLVGAFATAGVAALAACAPPAAAPAAAPSSGAAAEAPAAAAAPSTEPVTVRFHSRLGSHATWHISRIPLFEEQNPGIKLEIDELDGAEMYVKVYAMAASGTVGDVVWTYLDNPPEHNAKGVMTPLDDIIAAKGFDTSVFWPNLIEALTLDGKLMAIPNHAHFGTVIYYFNKTMFQDAGLELPNPEWTNADWVEAGKALTKAPETWGFRTNGSGGEYIPSYLRMFGGDLYSPDGTKTLIAEEKSVAALKWLYDLMYTDKVDPCICGTDASNNFIAGKVGAFNATPGFAANFYLMPKSDWTFEWDATVAPLGPTGLRGSQVSGAGFCITKNSKNPNEAFQVLDFYSTKEDGIEHVFGGAGSPGGRWDVWGSDRLGEISTLYKATVAAYPDGPKPWYRAANGRITEFLDTMNNNLAAIWTGAVGFDEGVQIAYEQMQAVLDKEPL
jgi:multiple sugar transport system substrate-binding protein